MPRPRPKAGSGAKYTLVAQARPDFIWVDDDIRMNNHGVAFACFCPTCLALISKTLDVPFDRESLVAALNDPARGGVREAWVQQNAETIASLMADVAGAIRAVDPAIATGLMTAGPGDLYFWSDARGKADVLEPADDGVRVLAEMRDYFRRPLGSCLTAFENELGGRVVVMGYAQWMFLQSVSKRAQLLNVADWITRGALPVRVDEAVPLVPFVRLSEDRTRAAVVLLNAGLDRIEQATVRLRLAGCERVEKVSGMAPWTTRILKTEG